MMAMIVWIALIAQEVTEESPDFVLHNLNFEDPQPSAVEDKKGFGLSLNRDFIWKSSTT